MFRLWRRINASSSSSFMARGTISTPARSKLAARLEVMESDETHFNPMTRFSKSSISLSFTDCVRIPISDRDFRILAIHSASMRVWRALNDFPDDLMRRFLAIACIVSSGSYL
jgi:hypothetical protein